MPLASRAAWPAPSIDSDQDFLWLPQMLSPSRYCVTLPPPADRLRQDCLIEAFEADLPPISFRQQVLDACAEAEVAGNA